MADTVPGAQAAREAGVALGQIYQYIKSGKVTNHKKGGWPEGKGIEVVLDEVIAAKATGRTRKPKVEGEEREKRPRVGRIKRSKGFDRPAHAGTTFQSTPRCPVDPDHGPLLPNDSAEGKKDGRIWLCSHQAHDQVGKHGMPTQLSFTQEETEMPYPVGPLGRVMLNWIGDGKSDLAREFESWLVEHEIPVWIPAR